MSFWSSLTPTTKCLLRSQRIKWGVTTESTFLSSSPTKSTWHWSKQDRRRESHSATHQLTPWPYLDVEDDDELFQENHKIVNWFLLAFITSFVNNNPMGIYWQSYYNNSNSILLPPITPPSRPYRVC